MRESIQKLDAEADMKLLRSTLALPEDSLLTLFIGMTLLCIYELNLGTHYLNLCLY